MTNTLRLATRASPLALWQANHVAELLRRVAADVEIELVTIETAGDQNRDKALSQIGGDGVFTKEIQLAVQKRRADVAVHSLKDLPTFAVEDIMLVAVPPRGPSGDVLVSNSQVTFTALPERAVVATSSVRRKAQLLDRRPDLRIVDIRGNVETRLRNLKLQVFDALVLAYAGLERLGLTEVITEVLDPSWMFPAVGQGALGLECRADDAKVRSLLAKIDHPPTSQSVRAERAMLHALGGGCQVPIGAQSKVEGETLSLHGVVLTADGSQRLEAAIAGPLSQAESLGRHLADELLALGAGRLLRGTRSS